MNTISIKKYIIATLSICMVVALASCNDFLDVKPKGMVMPEKTKDYEEMMGHSKFSNVADAVDFCGSDDVEMDSRYASMFVTMPYGKSHFWMKEFYKDSDDDPIWNGAYSAIFTCNVVLDRIMDSSDGSKTQKQTVIAEAKIQRAGLYFILHYLYAPAYSEKSAATEVSVPLITQPDLSAKPSRAKASEVVDLILNDIKDMDKYLPDNHINPFRLKKISANALFARIYLYLGDYENALKTANKVLAINNKLFDFNTLSFNDPDNPAAGVLGYPTMTESPETIALKYCGFSDITTMFAPSDDLVALFDKESDLRYRYQFMSTDYEGEPFHDGKLRFSQQINSSISVPEIMLIKAECLARKGDAACLDIINNLRKYRIEKSAYKPLVGTGKEQLLKLVLEERRRELMLNDMRWYDMKRLGKEGIYKKTVIRKLSNTTYTLTPNSPLYVFPIAPKVIKLNGGNITPTPR